MAWKEEVLKHPYMVLAFSIVTEVFGTTMMKMSDGFAVQPYGVLCVVGFLCSLTGLVFALKVLPLGLTYGIWGGVGTALTTVIGIIVWGDAFNALTAIGIVLVVGGIVLLNKGQKATE